MIVTRLIKINTLKPYVHLYNWKGLNDYFGFHIYACNYIGISLTVMGMGINMGFKIWENKYDD